jgi:hypothetical protein
VSRRPEDEDLFDYTLSGLLIAFPSLPVPTRIGKYRISKTVADSKRSRPPIPPLSSITITLKTAIPDLPNSSSLPPDRD